LIDFIAVQDYIANSSWGHNREVWRDRKNSKLWKWILVDMDRGFEASDISRTSLATFIIISDCFESCLQNNEFRNLFVQRYAQLMNHAFNTDRVVAKIDSIKSLIENEMPRHIEKWGT
jgi:spore coat protein CotH